MVTKFGTGVVLEHNEWRDYITEDDFIALKSFNCGIVRMHAIRGTDIMPTQGTYNMAFFTGKADQLVAWAKKYGMNITIDLGDYLTGPAFGGLGFPTWFTAGFADAATFQKAFWDINNPAGAMARSWFIDWWRFIANRYKNEAHVGFSIYNEPLNGPYAGNTFATNDYGMTDAQFSDYLGTSYSQFMETVIDAIRGTGATQPIVVNSPFLYYLTDQKKINRPNIYWDVHAYVDSGTNFASWSTNVLARYNYFASLGQPMTLGEYGIYPWDIWATMDYKTILQQQVDFLDAHNIDMYTWLGYGAFAGEWGGHLTAQQKTDVLTIVCSPALGNITPYNLTIATSGGGSTSPAPGVYPHDPGTSASVTAMPQTGYMFDHWELDGVNVGNALTYTLSNIQAILSLLAVFAQQSISYSLVAVSVPVTGIAITVDGYQYSTPTQPITLLEGPHAITAPSNVVVGNDIYNFVNWEDSTTNPARTINLTDDLTITCTYQVRIPPVAKGSVEIHAFLVEQELLAPYEIVGVQTGNTPDTVDLNVGNYTVNVTAQGTTLTQTVTITEGQTLRLDFQFAGAGGGGGLPSWLIPALLVGGIVAASI